MPSLLAAACERLWLLDENTLTTVLDVLDRKGDPEALEQRLGRPLANTHSVSVVDGVAVIPVTGVISRYANLFTDISGGTSTQMLATDMRAALDNPQIKGIVLNIDSPGGEATGINELATMIYEARGRKPITAYVGGLGASAAYWIASAADTVVLDATARVGSIGVVSSVRMKKSDTETLSIVSAQSPKKRLDPATEGGRTELQRIADELAGVFVDSVAKYRNTTQADVLQDFGEGGVRIGADAVARGMADRLGTLDGVITKMTEQRTEAQRIQRLEADLEQAQQQLGAERQRILAILDVGARLEPALRAAIEAGDSAEQYAYRFMMEQKRRGAPSLDALRADAPHVIPVPAPSAEAEAAHTRHTMAQRIAAAGKRS